MSQKNRAMVRKKENIMSEKKLQSVKVDKMPWSKFWMWKTRDVSLAAITVIINGYLMIFCSNTLGMSTALVGTLLMLSKLFDGFTDLFAGYIVDNTNTKIGKARPYELFIVLEWLFTVLLFFTGEHWALPLKCAWVFIMYSFVYSVCNTMLTANQTPYMVRAFSGNRNIITKVASFGGIVSMLCSIIVSITFPRIMANLVVARNYEASGWRTLILIFAIPLAIIGIMRFLFLKEDPQIDAGQTNSRIKLKEIVTMLKSNPYAWSFAGMIGLYQLAIGFGAGSYYFTYVVGDIGAFGLVSAMAMVLLPIMLIFPALIKKMGMAKLFIVMGVISFIGYVTVFFAGNSLAMVYLGVIVTNLVSLPCSYLQTPCIMDLSTFNEYNGFHRMEGTTGVVSGFTQKVLNGIGTGLTGVFMSVAGFVSSSSNMVVEQPSNAILMIRLLYSLIPGVCMIGIVLCALHFNKLEKRMPEIEAIVKERKQQILG